MHAAHLLQLWLNQFRTLSCRIRAIYYRAIFGAFGPRSLMRKPLLLSHPEYMYIGSDVHIRENARIECVLDGSGRIPELRIGDNSNIEQNCHIICHSRLTIGKNVSITANCAIVDTTHPYKGTREGEKIGDRILNEDSFVEIGDGALIGFGSVILPNVRIGRYAVIGANSLVSKSVPDFCIAAGNPAKVLHAWSLGADAERNILHRS